jgi:hypothetical protein
MVAVELIVIKPNDATNDAQQVGAIDPNRPTKERRSPDRRKRALWKAPFLDFSSDAITLD